MDADSLTSAQRLPMQREPLVTEPVAFLECNVPFRAYLELFSQIKSVTAVGLVYMATVLVADLTLASILFILFRRIAQGYNNARVSSGDALEPHARNTMNDLVSRVQYCAGMS
jgi:hypothetical protein